MDGVAGRHGQLWADFSAYLGQPEADAGHVAAALEALADEHRADGSAPRAAIRLQARVAALTDDPEVVVAALERAASEPLGDECALCDLRERAEALAAIAPEQALDLLDAIMSADQVCPYEPGRALALTAWLHARRGATTEALDAHHIGWRLVRDDEREAEAVGHHITALLLLGEVERAATHVLARRSWLETHRIPLDQLDLATTGAAALRAARHHVTVPEAIGDAEAVAEVADELETLAATLAADFDARLGTTAFSRRLHTRLDANLPLHAATLPPLQTRAPLTAIDLSGVSVPDLRTRLDAYLDTLDPLADDLVGWWLKHRESLIPTTTDAAALSELDRVASRALEGEDRVELLRHARRCAVSIHDEVLVDLADAELALATQPPDLAEASVREIADDLLKLGHAREAADVLGGWADDPRCPHSVDVLLTAAALLDGQNAHLDQAHHLVAAASALVGTDPSRARALLDRAGSLNAVAGHRYLRTEIRAQRGRLAWGAGDLSTADRLLHSSAAPPDTPPAALVARLLDLCEVRVERSDWSGVTAIAGRLAEVAADQREPLPLALAQRYLGFAALQAGQPYAAADLLEAALPVVAADEPDLVGPTAFALGAALAQIGDLVQASEAFISATAAFAAIEETAGEAQAALRTAEVLLQLGDAQGAEQRFSHSLARSGPDGPLRLVARVGLVHCALAQDRLEEGVAAAHDVLADLTGEDWAPQREALIGTVGTTLETAGRVREADEWWALLVD